MRRHRCLSRALALWFVLGSLACFGCARSGESGATEPQGALEASYSLVLSTEVEWEQLNPARGDKSPSAGTLWGSRTGAGPSGFLLRPVDGFRSPPHFHVATYRGMVIAGGIHNDEPEADDVFLPPGSFWTQPGGGVHITAAEGTSLAYIEVEDAFGVRPPDEAPAGVEQPSAVPASEIRWSLLEDTAGAGISTSLLWGKLNDESPSGMLIKLAPGAEAEIRSSGQAHAVLITGGLSVQQPKATGPHLLEPGSYFGAQGAATQEVSCVSDGDCTIYVRVQGELQVVPRGS